MLRRLALTLFALAATAACSAPAPRAPLPPSETAPRPEFRILPDPEVDVSGQPQPQPHRHAPATPGPVQPSTVKLPPHNAPQGHDAESEPLKLKPNSTDDGVKIQGAPIVQPAPPPAVIHTVARGESLDLIARRYSVSVASLRSSNALKSDVLQIGAKLRIPVAAPAEAKNAVDIFKQVIARQTWSVRPVRGNIEAMGKVFCITVHHTSELEAIKKHTDLAFVRSVEDAHQKRGMACIAYHYIIGRDGKVYEGRPANFMGAHARGANEGNIGIVLIGDFDRQPLPAAQAQALDLLLGALRTKYALKPADVAGHCDRGQTKCPGAALEQWVKLYRQRPQ